MKVPNIEPVHVTERMIHLFELQTAMQKFNFDKRPAIIDPYSNDVHERILAAIYYWNATTVEYAEMREETNNTYDLPQEQITEELVDMLHFILCQLLYVGFTGKEFSSLITIFEKVNNLEDHTSIGAGNAYWGTLSKAWGLLIDTLPYKIWKSYEIDEMRLVHSKEQVDLASTMLYSFVGLCISLKVSEDDLYLGYINKNVENFKRQMPGGKYEN